ncbi:transglutaminase domain-containing protein [Clostridium sp.]|uniref:transglutaminase domain-containing protein n=1 Tax=Clostridium sp. TaxID=1506 RepID=UPI003D6C9B5B
MKKNNVLFRILILTIIIAAVILWNFKFKNAITQEGLIITKWDNFYSGDNIHFYYLSPQNENLLKLKVKYGLNNIIDNKADALDNSIKIMKFINGKVKAKSTSMSSDKNTLQIMEVAFGGGEISDSDYVAMYEECLASVGIKARRGILRGTDNKIKGKSYFNVCEIWSDKYKKWIMIDGVNGYYMQKDGIPLGAVETINTGIEKVKIYDLKDTSKYIKSMKNYYESYSIYVDNNKYGELKSNSQITYLKDKQLPKIETKEGFTQPTIFVNSPKVFNISPEIKYEDTGNDKVATLIFAKRDLKDDTKEIQNFTVGAFINSYMLTNYFISVNGSDYIKVDTFFELQIIEGINSIKLSQDGKNVSKEVVIEK